MGEPFAKIACVESLSLWPSVRPLAVEPSAVIGCIGSLSLRRRANLKARQQTRQGSSVLDRVAALVAEEKWLLQGCLLGEASAAQCVLFVSRHQLSML